MTSGKKCYPPHSEWRQVVVSIDRKAQTFTTMARQDSRLVLRTFDSACRKIDECTVPLFTDSYAGCPHHYALSSDGRNVVYFKDSTKNLYLYNISTGNETQLWERIANSRGEISLLAWISDSRILVGLQEYPDSDRKTNVIAVLDIASGELTTIHHPIYTFPFLDYAVTRDASLLAFRDGNKPHDIHGVIKVLDVRTGAVKATLGNGGELMSNPCWNPDGSELAYIEGCELKIWTAADNTTRILRSFPDEFTCYKLVFGTGMVGYVKGGLLGWSVFDRLVIVDSRHGAKLRTIAEPFNGGTFLINGTTVVCEIGY